MENKLVWREIKEKAGVSVLGSPRASRKGNIGS